VKLLRRSNGLCLALWFGCLQNRRHPAVPLLPIVAHPRLRLRKSPRLREEIPAILLKRQKPRPCV
jgi:hypothetical protein